MGGLNKKIKVDLREIVFSNEEGKSFCDIFIYEPENIEEQGLGNLYIVGEIVNFSDNSSYLVNLLASIAKKEFYANPKKSTIESLESSLHKVNTNLSKITEQGNIDWIGNLNMACGTYKSGELHISQVGKIKTILIRDGQVTDIGKDITNEENPHPFKTFANIASGDLEIGDLVLLATPELFNVFSTEKLAQFSSSLDIEQLSEIIQDSIEKENNINTMGVLIMKIEEDKEDKMNRVKIESKTEIAEKEFTPVLQEKILEEKSMIQEGAEEIHEENLQVIEIDQKEEPELSEKEERLSLEDIIKKYESQESEKSIKEKQKYEEKLDKKKKRESDEFLMDFEEKPKNRIINKILKKLKQISAKMSLTVFNKVKNIIQKTQSNSSGEMGDEISQKTSLLFEKKKLILVLFGFVVLTLFGGLVFNGWNNNQEKLFNDYENKISQAEEKISQAEINSINNPSDAIKYLLEAKDIINSRDASLNKRENYQELNNRAVTLLSEIDKQLDIFNFVIRIENPNIAIDLGLTEELKNSKQIIRIGNNFYVSNFNNKSLYEINFKNKTANNLNIKSDDIDNFKFTTPIDKLGEIVFLTDSNKIGIYDISDEKFKTTEIKLAFDSLEITDIASYSSFLYILSASSNQIYKYPKTTNKFEQGDSWIKDQEADIKNAISMTIDGSIYILKSDGTIDKYLSGGKFLSSDRKEFSIETISDPISPLAKLYTKAKLKYLYVSDPQKNRILIFNKINGNLIQQYISNKFDNLKNIVIDEKEEKIYVLNGDKVFEIKIEIEE
ncbi:MAG: hypothetical protein P1P85_04655 [Patescibacteria group bacterium]|nr:hypothetical protein [Patescibacteria group bacterium]